MRRLLRIAVLSLLSLACIAAVTTSLSMRASLPRRSGSVAMAGIDAAVELEFDGYGIPRIRTATLSDAFAAQGFVHAQDRFFQMDLLRRQSAGELSELFGGNALAVDRRMRLHRFRTLAERLVDDSPTHVAELLAAYTGGVNAGLAALRASYPARDDLGGAEPAQQAA